MSSDLIDVLIIGSGPAGYTAGIYLARAGMNVTILAGETVGGQLSTTTEVENFPGIITTGPELMDSMLEHAEKMGCKIIYETVNQVDLGADIKTVYTVDGKYESRAVIICTGSYAKYLGIPNELELLGRGVSGCATCDGFFFTDQDVAVVGGGNTALEEALFLSKMARKVTILVRGDKFKAEKVLIDKVLSNSKIKVLMQTTIDKIVGSDGLEKIILSRKNGDFSNVALEELIVSGLFIAIGHNPNTDLFKGQLDLKDTGYINVDLESGVKTSIGGVFAAGDVCDDKYRQAITSAGAGCKAALEAIEYLG